MGRQWPLPAEAPGAQGASPRQAGEPGVRGCTGLSPQATGHCAYVNWVSQSVTAVQGAGAIWERLSPARGSCQDPTWANKTACLRPMVP